MDLIDRIAAVGLIICTVAGVGWWLTVWVPEREEHLFEVHDCFVETGCNDRRMATPEIEECWSMCAAHVRSDR